MTKVKKVKPMNETDSEMPPEESDKSPDTAKEEQPEVAKEEKI